MAHSEDLTDGPAEDLAGDLDRLLRRPNLDPAERLLVRAQALIWPGNWRALEESFRRAREVGVARTDLEELLLQGILFCGFPRMIQGFRCLQTAWPVASPPSGGGLPVSEQVAAGRELFAAIYGKNTEPVHDMLRSYHSELHDFVLEAAYGRVLSRPGMEPRVRELVALGALSVMEQTPQLVAHGRGAMRFGASREQVYESIYTALGNETQARRLLRKVDG